MLRQLGLGNMVSISLCWLQEAGGGSERAWQQTHVSLSWGQETLRGSSGCYPLRATSTPHPSPTAPRVPRAPHSQGGPGVSAQPHPLTGLQGLHQLRVLARQDGAGQAQHDAQHRQQREEGDLQREERRGCGLHTPEHGGGSSASPILVSPASEGCPPNTYHQGERPLPGDDADQPGQCQLQVHKPRGEHGEKALPGSGARAAPAHGQSPLVPAGLEPAQQQWGCRSSPGATRWEKLLIQGLLWLGSKPRPGSVLYGHHGGPRVLPSPQYPADRAEPPSPPCPCPVVTVVPHAPPRPWLRAQDSPPAPLGGPHPSQSHPGGALGILPQCTAAATGRGWGSSGAALPGDRRPAQPPGSGAAPSAPHSPRSRPRTGRSDGFWWRE